jgi:transposase-like protein
MRDNRKNTLMSKYRKLMDSTRENLSMETTDLAGDLDAIAREGARRMPVSVLEAEVTEFLGRERYERKELSPGYRNGYGKQRQVTLGSGTVSVRAPRVRHTEERFVSQVLPSYRRRSQAITALIPELYVQGLVTGDFEPALRGLLGEEAQLSASTVVRLKEQWQSEYEA